MLKIRRAAITFAAAAVLAAQPAEGQSPDSALHSRSWWDTTGFVARLPASTLAQLELAARAARQLPTLEAARRARYQRLAAPHINDLNVLAGEHWLNNDVVRAPLDLSRPAYLMFYPMGDDRRWTLVGIAYGILQAADAASPEGFEGEADAWHFHLYCRDLPDVPVALAHDSEDCQELGGRVGRSQIAMVHVWVNVPNPDGPLAHENPVLPYAALGLVPPTRADLADPDRSRRLRTLALALGETFGAVPRLAGLVNRHPDSALARRVARHQARLRAWLPNLRQADRTGDRAHYETIADSMIAEWEHIREAYLDAASPTLRVLIGRWIERVTDSRRHRHSHTQGHSLSEHVAEDPTVGVATRAQLDSVAEIATGFASPSVSSAAAARAASTTRLPVPAPHRQ